MIEAPVMNQINVVSDYAGADDFAKKHTPLIDITDMGEKKLVTVTVGKEVAHPNLAEHYITWIELMVNGNPVARFDLSPVVTDPKVSVTVTADPGSEISAMEHCNLHGLWTYSVTV